MIVPKSEARTRIVRLAKDLHPHAAEDLMDPLHSREGSGEKTDAASAGSSTQLPPRTSDCSCPGPSRRSREHAHPQVSVPLGEDRLHFFEIPRELHAAEDVRACGPARRAYQREDGLRLNGAAVEEGTSLLRPRFWSNRVSSDVSSAGSRRRPASRPARAR